MTAPKLTYCTTCMDRLEYLRAAFDNNAKRIAGLPIEWVILDYGSKRQDVVNWLRVKRAKDPELFAQVRAFHAPPQENWHAARAKNVAHTLSSAADVVCNIDCDTFIVPGHPQFILETAGEGCLISPPEHGMYGTVAMRKLDFFALGGYDEDFRYYGYEDVDLVERAMRMGLRRTVWDERYWVAIANEVKTENSCQDLPFSMKASWHILTRNRRRPAWAANQGRAWGFTPGVEEIIF